MKKSETLELWRRLSPGLNPLPKMSAIPYKARGSRYGACGIRIDGNPEFIDAVLSNLKALLDGENHLTRLELSRNEVDGRGLDKSFDNADTAAQVCYVRLHQRGNQGTMASAIFDRDLDGATLRFTGEAKGEA
jgi:hypothetical protein